MALSDNTKITTLYKERLGVGNTRVNREFFEEALKSSFSVSTNQIWCYGDEIPGEGSSIDDINAIRNLTADNDLYVYHKDESTSVKIVKYYEDVRLTKIDNGTDNAFVLKDENGEIITDVIPFNFYEDVYNYTLKDFEGYTLPFGVGDWVFDTHSSILTFNGDLPDTVDHMHPPSLTFYRYVGGHGFRTDMKGFEAALIPIQSFDIPENTFSFTASENITLQQEIINQADKVEEDFVKTYGWDGADNNEGVATSYEYVVPLLYSKTKDKVKGYDDSNDSSVLVLLTKNKVIETSEDAFMPDIKFVSNKVLPGEHYIKVSTLEQGALLSFDDGPEVLFEPEATIKLNSDNGFIVIETSIGFEGTEAHESKKYKFTTDFDLDRTSDGITTAGLFYWSIKKGDFVPFFTKEKNTYDFSFPIVMQNGKIPPSVKLNAESLQYFEDSITPDYYGPRLHSIIIALEGTDAVKSADYVVKNSVSFYVKDILAKIKEERPGFKGIIYFRSGTYEISNPTTASTSLTTEDLDFGTDLIIQGESKELVKFTNEVTVQIDLSSNYFVGLKDITFDNRINLNSKMTNALTLNNVDAYSLSIEKNDDSLLSIYNSSIKNCIIAGAANAEYYVNRSSFDNLTVKCIGARVTDCVVQNLIVDKYANILSNTIGTGYFNVACDVAGNTILLLNEKVEYSIFRGNYVAKYNSNISDINGVPKANTFPIYNKESLLKYTTFDDPITYDSDTNKFIVKYDNITIQLDDDGRLHVVIDATQISVYGAINYPRDPSFVKELKNMSEEERQKRFELLGVKDYEAPSTDDEDDDSSNSTGKYEIASTTLEDILKYIFRYKADLVSGKVPLQQIPDSIAGGGLHYCSNWSIEENGRFPQFEDVINEALRANYDTEVEELQPGWFVVVDASRVEEKNPTKEQFLQPTKQQADNTYTRGLSSKYPDFDDAIQVAYTAGDWIIFSHYLTDSNGNKVLDENGELIPIWDKVDRSYNDPIYTRLPSYDFEGRNWRWDDESEDNPGKGEIDFADKTLYEAISQTNEELNKLKVKHPPLLSKFTFEPVQDYPTITYKELALDDTGNSGYLYQARTVTRYDATDLQEFKVISSKEDNWNSYIYFGQKAMFRGFILHNGNETAIPSNDLLEYVGKLIAQDQMTILDAVDPFENELAGSNYWKGTKITFSIDNPDNGVYKIYAQENNITPLLQQIEDQTTSVATFEFFKNYEIKAAANEDIIYINYNDLIDRYVKWNCGRPYLSINDGTLNYRVSFVVRRAFKQQFYEKIMEYHTSYDDEDVWHSFDELVERSTYRIVRNANEPEYFDLFVDELQVDVTRHDVPFNLKVKVFDLYGKEQILEVYNRDDIYGNFDISEVENEQRVFSGILMEDEVDDLNKPTFSNTSTTAHFAGNPFNHRESLLDNMELMTFQDTPDGPLYYAWPKGTYYTVDDKVAAEYDNIYGQKIKTADLEGEFRFITLYLGDIEESNGFTLRYDSENIDYDTLSCVNKNMSMQVLVDADKVWYNANKPMPYLFEPTKFNDACMYAGNSSVNVRRISFGKRLLTGKVYVRLGIEKESGIKLSNIRIDTIV